MDNNVDNDREEREEAVLNADDTGLVKQQRVITDEEIELAEEGFNKPLP